MTIYQQALTGWQLSKISKIEHGKQKASEDDIRAWCLHSNTEDQVPDLIATVRHIETLWLEWRRTLQTGVKVRQQRSLSLYRKTKVFRAYHPTVVWGTLQTAEYTAAAFRQVVDFSRSLMTSTPRWLRVWNANSSSTAVTAGTT